jgi:hypothetical protein
MISDLFSKGDVMYVIALQASSEATANQGLSQQVGLTYILFFTLSII